MHVCVCVNVDEDAGIGFMQEFEGDKWGPTPPLCEPREVFERMGVSLGRTFLSQ